MTKCVTTHSIHISPCNRMNIPLKTVTVATETALSPDCLVSTNTHFYLTASSIPILLAPGIFRNTIIQRTTILKHWCISFWRLPPDFVKSAIQSRRIRILRWNLFLSFTEPPIRVKLHRISLIPSLRFYLQASKH